MHSSSEGLRASTCVMHPRRKGCEPPLVSCNKALFRFGATRQTDSSIMASLADNLPREPALWNDPSDANSGSWVDIRPRPGGSLGLRCRRCHAADLLMPLRNFCLSNIVRHGRTRKHLKLTPAPSVGMFVELVKERRKGISHRSESQAVARSPVKRNKMAWCATEATLDIQREQFGNCGWLALHGDAVATYCLSW